MESHVTVLLKRSQTSTLCKGVSINRSGGIVAARRVSGTVGGDMFLKGMSGSGVRGCDMFCGKGLSLTFSGLSGFLLLSLSFLGRELRSR